VNGFCMARLGSLLVRLNNDLGGPEPANLHFVVGMLAAEYETDLWEKAILACEE